MPHSGPLDKQIIDDHAELRNYSSKFWSALEKKDLEEARLWYNSLVWENSRHAVCEELVLYPMMEHRDEQGKEFAAESRNHHQGLKETLHKAEHSEFGGPEFTTAMREFDRILQHHLEEEEQHDLQYVRTSFTKEELDKAGSKFSRSKHFVPTRPHPHVPDSPPFFESALGLMIAPIDKLRDLFRDYPEHDEDETS